MNASTYELLQQARGGAGIKQAGVVDTLATKAVGPVASTSWDLAKSLATILTVITPVAAGGLAGYQYSKMTEPSDTDLKNYERAAYDNELNQRTARLKSLPAAKYEDVNNRTLRL